MGRWTVHVRRASISSIRCGPARAHFTARGPTMCPIANTRSTACSPSATWRSDADCKRANDPEADTRGSRGGPLCPARGIDVIPNLASRAVHEALLQERTPEGYWQGYLSSSALSTATAVVALALSARERPNDALSDRALAQRGIAWLLDHQ